MSKQRVNVQYQGKLFAVGIPIVLIFFFGCVGSSVSNVSQPSSSSVNCLGNPEASNTIVYLHGLDTEPPGPQELENRKILTQLAETAQVRIALPRGSEICGKLHCWGWNSDDKEARLAAQAIERAAQFCSPKYKSIGLIGFSSGGYIAMKLFRSNIFHEIGKGVRWAIVVGSGMMKGHLEPNPKSVKGYLMLLIGDKDKGNYDLDQNYFHLLTQKSQNVSLKVFSGGHEIPSEELRAIAIRSINGEYK